LDLNSLKVFTEVVTQGSFSGASKTLGMPVSTVSRKVSEFEESLGSKLMERSTRNLRLTEAGETLHQYALRSVEEMEAGVMALEEKQNQVEGILRIALPPNFEIGWEGLKSFMRKYPKVKLQTVGISREVDLIADHIDVAVQYQASENPSVISRKITTVTPILVASQNYVNIHGQPQTPSELGQFHCLVRENPGFESYWTLDGEKIKISPYLSSNEFSVLRDLVINDFGIAQLPPLFRQSEIDSGEFVEILPQCSAPVVDIHLVYASRKHLSRVTRAFIDYAFQFKDEHAEYWNSDQDDD